MQLRPPSVPLITVDPNFSVWSSADRLYDTATVHWTGRKMPLYGALLIDGERYRFMGAENSSVKGEKTLTQKSLDVSACSSTYTFCGAGIELTAIFTTPLLLSDLKLASRPVSFLELVVCPTDGECHSVTAEISVGEEICLDYAGEDAVAIDEVKTADGIATIRMGSKSQPVLEKFGDDLRIDWGYFYLSCEGEEPAVESVTKNEHTRVRAVCGIETTALFSFAYDDIYSINYFGDRCRSLWNQNGEKITDVITEAHAGYIDVFDRCSDFSDKLFADAVRAGGEKYAEMLLLAYRQAIGAHKIAVDADGELLFISKECFSNGCAATVDVSYPSIPLFLLYEPELIKGMMRPIYKYAATDEWKVELGYDFAPHDAGKYPFVTGQQYGKAHDRQMPVEECGNMLLMEAAVALAERDASFAAEHIEVLAGWVKYLEKYGTDPGDQLCTDDFAGHLAHNCNLALKAIMGIAGYGIILEMLDRKDESVHYFDEAKKMADEWLKNAANDDGSYRLAFDRDGSWSMKYNLVWDKLFGTSFVPRVNIESELARNLSHANTFGMPLDNRSLYTKSDWLVWTATLAADRREFEMFTDPMWEMYNTTPSRVPMTDWYYTHTGLHKAYMSKSSHPDAVDGRVEKSFRNRTVIGGLFIKLLEYKGYLKR